MFLRFDIVLLSLLFSCCRKTPREIDAARSGRGTPTNLMTPTRATLNRVRPPSRRGPEPPPPPQFRNPKVNALQTKWNRVTNMTLDRRRKLQETLEYLKEVSVSFYASILLNDTSLLNAVVSFLFFNSQKVTRDYSCTLVFLISHVYVTDVFCISVYCSFISCIVVFRISTICICSR